MDAEAEWERIRGDRDGPAIGAGGAVRMALLFGAGAVALALLVTPFLEGQARLTVARSGRPANLDFTATGTVDRGSSYTIRRSVLQPSPASICVIRQNGGRIGDC